MQFFIPFMGILTLITKFIECYEHDDEGDANPNVVVDRQHFTDEDSNGITHTRKSTIVAKTPGSIDKDAVLEGMKHGLGGNDMEQMDEEFPYDEYALYDDVYGDEEPFEYDYYPGEGYEDPEMEHYEPHDEDGGKLAGIIENADIGGRVEEFKDNGGIAGSEVVKDIRDNGGIIGSETAQNIKDNRGIEGIEVHRVDDGENFDDEHYDDGHYDDEHYEGEHYDDEHYDDMH